MSKTNKSYMTRESVLKEEGKFTGYAGEQAWRSKARRWFARLVHKRNRKTAKAQINTALQME